MSIAIARRLAAAIGVKSETSIRAINAALLEYVRLTRQSATIPSSGNIDAAQVISGTFDDARIAESNVTQHDAAIAAAWANLSGVPATFPPSAHTHAAEDDILGAGLSDFANDGAAASGGVDIGGLYRNGSVVQVRVS